MEVPVGMYLPGGTFEGKRIEFDGRDVGVYDGGLYTGAGNPDEVYGFNLAYRLWSDRTSHDALRNVEVWLEPVRRLLQWLVMSNKMAGAKGTNRDTSEEYFE
jgi:hypothetical protein